MHSTPRHSRFKSGTWVTRSERLSGFGELPQLRSLQRSEVEKNCLLLKHQCRNHRLVDSPRQTAVGNRGDSPRRKLLQPGPLAISYLVELLRNINLHAIDGKLQPIEVLDLPTLESVIVEPFALPLNGIIAGCKQCHIVSFYGICLCLCPLNNKVPCGCGGRLQAIL